MCSFLGQRQSFRRCNLTECIIKNSKYFAYSIQISALYNKLENIIYWYTSEPEDDLEGSFYDYVCTVYTYVL